MGKFEAYVFGGIIYFAIFMWTFQYTDSLFVSIICFVLFLASLGLLENYFSRPRKNNEDNTYIKKIKRKKRKSKKKRTL